MSCEVHARFCEGPRGRFPRSTHPNVYVRSQRAGERVTASLTRILEGELGLEVNRVKSAVDRPWKRKLLGSTVTHQSAPRLTPAPESVQRAKDRIRQLTHQGRGRTIPQVIPEIKRYTRGWSGYFRLATVPHAFESLDPWRRRRLRKILWEPWRRPTTRYRQLVAPGGLKRSVHARQPPQAVGPGGMPGPHTGTRP